MTFNEVKKFLKIITLILLVSFSIERSKRTSSKTKTKRTLSTVSTSNLGKIKDVKTFANVDFILRKMDNKTPIKKSFVIYFNFYKMIFSFEKSENMGFGFEQIDKNTKHEELENAATFMKIEKGKYLLPFRLIKEIRREERKFIIEFDDDDINTGEFIVSPSSSFDDLLIMMFVDEIGGKAKKYRNNFVKCRRTITNNIEYIKNYKYTKEARNSNQQKQLIEARKNEILTLKDQYKQHSEAYEQRLKTLDIPKNEKKQLEMKRDKYEQQINDYRTEIENIKKANKIANSQPIPKEMKIKEKTDVAYKEKGEAMAVLKKWIKASYIESIEKNFEIDVNAVRKILNSINPFQS